MSNYVLDDNNNKVIAYSAEEVLSVLEQAIADGSLADLVADAAFVTKLKCCVSGQTNKIAFVTEAQYNELAAAGTVENGVYYYITDDTTLDSINEILTELQTRVGDIEGILPTLNENVNKIVSGEQSVGNATKVNNLEITQDENGVLKIGDIIIPQKKLIFESAESKQYYQIPITNNVIEIEFLDNNGNRDGTPIRAGASGTYLCYPSKYNYTEGLWTFAVTNNIVHRYSNGELSFTKHIVFYNHTDGFCQESEDFIKPTYGIRVYEIIE